MTDNPIYVAIDKMDVFAARDLADEVRGVVGGLKIGLGFWLAHGVSAVRHVTAGHDWFMDLKFHDIPDQIDGAIRSAMQYGPRFISIHIDDQEDGNAMLEAAMQAAHQEAEITKARRPLILGVTYLSSLTVSATDVLRKGYRAQRCGLDGIVCANEAKLLRSELNSDLLIVSPGIRPIDSPDDDHKRSMTPRQATEAGVNYMVIGRPITRANDRRQAAVNILESTRPPIIH